jgi:uncharacterized protein DUF3830
VAAPFGVVDADPDREVLEEVGVPVERGGIGRQVEDELVVADLERPGQERADSPIGVRHALGEELGPAILLEPEERHRQSCRGHTQLEIQDVGRDGGTGIGHCYPPRMPNLTIRVGDLNFTARWEPEAPRTVEAVRRLLPLESELIHCRWSGEGTWIPLGDLRIGVAYEHHTSHPAPGELLIYTGELSECEILLPYGACSFSSKLGQLAGNHFATLGADDGWRDRLQELGRRVLWEGAQQIEIREDG